MIKVGVNDNVIISKAEINDKGTLVVSVAEIGTEIREAKKSSIMEDMSDGSDTSGNTGTGESNFLMYMPQLVEFDKDEAGNDKPREGKDILASFIDLKNQLSHFLKRFVVTSQIKFAPFAGVMYNGAPLNVANDADILAAVATELGAKKIYNNYCEQFVAQVKPYLNMETKPSRLFLHRKSAEKHFGTLRKKFLDNQPFFEDMAIPVPTSKMFIKATDDGKTTKLHEPIEIDGVKYVPNFSAYELKNKLDNTERVEAKADTSSADAEQEIQNVENLFTAQLPGATIEGQEGGTGMGGFTIEE